MTLGILEPDGTPRLSPVRFVADGMQDLYWASAHLAQHSRNLALRPAIQVVIYNFASPVPGSKWKQTVPVKISLADAAGSRITDSTAAALANACSVKFSASGAQSSGPTCTKYDAVSHQFVHPWKIAGKTTGEVTVSVTVFYGPGTTSNRLSEAITITR